MIDRFRRQKAYHHVGESGQQRLRSAHVAIVGVGALGSTVAERLVRAGVGEFTLIDRDWVEFDNLPRQTLYTEQDAIDVLPKATAIAQHLSAIDTEVRLHLRVGDLHCENIKEWLGNADCIVDGTDNFETRFLINDYACSENKPWFHAGIVGANGQSLSIVPDSTACFRCLLPEPPPAEHMQTCDSAGVLGPAVGVIASWQAMEVMKWILKGKEAIDGSLRTFDLWNGEVRKLRLPRVHPSNSGPGCLCCIQRQFEFLSGRRSTQAKAICGRNSVQMHSTLGNSIDLEALKERLQLECEVTSNPYFLRFEIDQLTWTVFRDGRAILSGTEDIELARKLYARRVGS